MVFFSEHTPFFGGFGGGQNWGSQYALRRRVSLRLILDLRGGKPDLHLRPLAAQPRDECGMFGRRAALVDHGAEPRPIAVEERSGAINSCSKYPLRRSLSSP
jgi:hypothetical protein